MKVSPVLLFFPLLLASMLSCKSDSSSSDRESVVNIRLPTEPDMLNPARSNSSYATQIESLIMYPLAELDPQKYTLDPLLIESLTASEAINAGPDSGDVVFRYKIRDEAVWDDGKPVTGNDYAFTIKMALNPKVDAAQWRGFLTLISDVLVDSENPRKFEVIINEPYMLADVVSCNFNIYPAHVYDSAGYMKDISVRLLSDPRSADSIATADAKLQQFAEQFMQVKYANEIVVGCGPYRLVSWETGQRIILERKTDWWGDKIANKPMLMHALPQRLVYEIVPDENTALTMLKDGSIDVISEISPATFLDLRADSSFQDKLQFFTPKLLQVNYLDLNNQHPILRDKKVRKALAHVIDYDGLVSNVTQGMGQRTIGPFHPDVDYYNDDLIPVPYDMDKARTLLSEAGWKDSNGNGVLDKVIGGKLTELNLDISISQRPEGQAVALLLKESAAKAGIEIDIVTKESNVLQQDKRNRAFEILPYRNRADVVLSDPYQSWHSDSDTPGGGNSSGFRNAEADSLIMQIRTSASANERNTAYKEFQRVLAEEQPVIFLYVPLERLIVSKRFELQPSSRKPGYFENLFVRTDM